MKYLHIDKLARLIQCFCLFVLFIIPFRAFGQYLLGEEIVSLDGNTDEKYLHLGVFGPSEPFYTVPICFLADNALQEYSKQIVKLKVNELTVEYERNGWGTPYERQIFLFDNRGRIYQKIEMYSMVGANAYDLRWGEKTEIFSDENGRIQRIEERNNGIPYFVSRVPMESAFLDDPKRIIKYGYQPDGSLNEILVQTGSLSYGDSVCFRVQHDKVGKVSEIWELDANGHVVGRKVFSRDRKGNLTRIEETNNRNDTKLVKKYTYDNYGQLIMIVDPLEERKVKIAYNKSNQIIERWADDATKTVYTYDDNKLLIRFVTYGNSDPKTGRWDGDDYLETKIEYESNGLPRLRERTEYFNKGGRQDLVTKKKIYVTGQTERTSFSYKYSN